MKVEMGDKVSAIVDLKANQDIWSPAVTHKSTNTEKKHFSVIVAKTIDCT